MSNSVVKQGKIGNIQDNRIEDMQLAQRILMCGREALNLGRQGKPKTVQELQDRFNTYLDVCVSYGLPPTVEGMALSIDYDRRTVYDIENQKAKVQFSDTVKRMKDYIATYDASLGMSNKVNAAIYCFRAKNMYGMKDVQEIKATSDFNADPENPEKVVEALPEVDEDNFIELEDK